MRYYIGQTGLEWNQAVPCFSKHILCALDTSVDCLSPVYSMLSFFIFSQLRELIINLTPIIYGYSTIQAFWSIQKRRACSIAIFILPFFIPSRLATASRNSASNFSSITRLICPISIYYRFYLDIKLSLYLDNNKLFILITR
jgi:hypothetical protein